LAHIRVSSFHTVLFTSVYHPTQWRISTPHI